MKMDSFRKLVTDYILIYEGAIVNLVAQLCLVESNIRVFHRNGQYVGIWWTCDQNLFPRDEDDDIWT
jgi:hypothetical protein